jgi:ATP-dependent DNA helicase RecQ
MVGVAALFMQPQEAFQLDRVLTELFGLAEFRPWQREAIIALLHGSGQVLVVAPTGGGKSLTFQVPAAVLPGTTLVLSPLVALMEDQVRALLARGIPATFLASTLDAGERRQREAGLVRGAYRLVYAAPERLASSAFVDLLAAANISLVAVDEAHCISHWGHDFRPDYLRIGALVQRLRPPRILACTATATPVVRAEIKKQLGLGESCVEVLRGFARPNLHLSAHAVTTKKDAERQVAETLKDALGSPRAPRGGAILYAATRRAAEQWASWLSGRGYRAAVYHAGLDADERTETANRFAARTVDVVAATNAFGMGIDRPDIRAVVHVQPPASIEAYYQEVGRAGRDGDEAYGVLLCGGADIALRRRLVGTGKDGVPLDPALAARAWSMFRELLRYFDARSCRHDFVLRYFGDERELLGGCGHCDVCETIDAAASDSAEDGEEASIVVRKALSAVARADGRSGLVAVADMLRGKANERTRRLGFTELSTFGLFEDRSEDWVVAVLRSLLAAGLVDVSVGDYPLVLITRAGRDVMHGRAPARIALPQEPVRKKPAPGASEARRAEVVLDGDDGRVFERLREHRADVARQRRVPAYVVALDRTLVELARVRPRSLEELEPIFGMGPVRIDQYGVGFLGVLSGDSKETVQKASRTR